MTDFWEAMTELAGALEQFRPALDTRDLNPPGVLILPPVATFRFADGTWAADWTVIAVVPNAGTKEAVTALSSLVAGVRAALDGQPLTATPHTLTADGITDPLPAYQLTWNARIR